MGATCLSKELSRLKKKRKKVSRESSRFAYRGLLATTDAMICRSGDLPSKRIIVFNWVWANGPSLRVILTKKMLR